MPDEVMKLDADIAIGLQWLRGEIGSYPPDDLKRSADAIEAALRSPVTEGGRGLCPICAEPFRDGDMCSTDIDVGMCHAKCLEGSPTVDLDTGEPIDGPIATYPYEPIEHRSSHHVQPTAAAVEALKALVDVVASETLGDAVANDPDEDSVGWNGEGPLPMTFGHVRRAQKAIAALSAIPHTGGVKVKPLEWETAERRALPHKRLLAHIVYA